MSPQRAWLFAPGIVTSHCIDHSMHHVAYGSNVTLVIDKHHCFELHYMANHTY